MLRAWGMAGQSTFSHMRSDQQQFMVPQALMLLSG